MIKFSAVNHESGLPVLGIGLTRAECEGLLQGQPLQFTTENMPSLAAIEVFVMGGATEADMALAMLAEIPNLELQTDDSLVDPFIRQGEEVN